MSHLTSYFLISVVICINAYSSNAFIPQNFHTIAIETDVVRKKTQRGQGWIATGQSWSASSSALNIWWFGGTETSETVEKGADSCELVAVRIERTSANSRKIMGEITVERRLMDVWAILTDYNRLTTHIPNLTESKIVGRPQVLGEQGDGSFKCRLFQRGAQKIVGFDFQATVTMDMTEKIVKKPSSQRRLLASSSNQADDQLGEPMLMDDRMIEFKCADSFFFDEFDGRWLLKEQYNSRGEFETVVSYDVDVRPKGPVPVAALEWRIREDVPTNLRAVKKAAILVGEEGVMKSRQKQGQSAVPNGASKVQRVSTNRVDRAMKMIVDRRNELKPTNKSSSMVSNNSKTMKKISMNRVNRAMKKVAAKQRKNRTSSAQEQIAVTVPVPVWDRDETMAAYLKDV